MISEQGFWNAMPGKIRVRFGLGVVFFLIAGGVLSVSPISGIILLMLPLLWSVLVTWFGSEAGRGYGPYSLSRDTALAYLLRHIWRTSALTRWILALLTGVLVTGGLGWISTEDMRTQLAEPGLAERATTVADRTAEVTKDTASSWYSKARGWFTSDDTTD